MVQRLSRFSVGQTAKVLGLLYGLMGLIAVPIFVLVGMFSGEEEEAFGVGFALVVPIIYGVLGFVFTAIGCLVYNWVAGKVGGIELSLDSAVEKV